MIKGAWWKITGVIFILYSIIAGLLFPVPAMVQLHETIRNLFYHVSMWFTMIFLMIISLVCSIRYLRNGKSSDDDLASECVRVAMLFGILGLATGSLWAKFTWSETPLLSASGWWVNDVKLNGALAAVLVYSAYLLLRNSVEDESKRARLSAVYNIFAFALMNVFILILPRLNASLHPGNGGNPGFVKYDLDSTMRWVFYPSIIGWILVAMWIVTLKIRVKKINVLLNYH